MVLKSTLPQVRLFACAVFCALLLNGGFVAYTEAQQAPPVPTRWIPYGSDKPQPPPGAVEIGQDLGNGANRTIYVCRAQVGASGLIPGKVVAGRCNVPFANTEFRQTVYDVLIGNAGCFAAPHNSRAAFVAADSAVPPQRFVCRTHYLADRGIHIILPGESPQDDEGEQGGVWVPENSSCRFGFDGHVEQVVLAEVYYAVCPQATQHSPTAPGPVHQGDPHIASATVSPSTISAGMQATLTVTLDRPAPAGGFVVGVAHITNTGLDDVIVNMPNDCRFAAGASSCPFVINTRHETDDVTDIIFKAFHFNEEKDTELKINP
jgi:hypothetical protein